MSKILNTMRFAVVAVVLALGLLLKAALTNVDFVTLSRTLLDGIKKHDVDEVLIGLVLIAVGMTTDRILSYRRKRHQAEVDAQNLRSFCARAEGKESDR